ncbi:MAG: hypothetical protein ACI30J_03705 [Paludibacteraceae bacterium]
MKANRPTSESRFLTPRALQIIRYVVFPLLIVFAWLLVANYTFNSKPDMNGDNFCYYIYASSLAEGNGYCDLSSPGTPATSNFPPGYPLLMTPMRAITDSVVAQKWLNEVFVLLSILLLYFSLLTLELPQGISFTAAFAGLFCPRLLHFSTMMMSEASFLFMSMLVFFALIQMTRDEEKWWSEVRSPWLYVMIIALVFTYHIRTQGIALVAGVLLVLLVRKRWAALSVTIMGFVIGCLPWMVRNRMLGLNGNRYLDAIMVANPWRPEMGNIGFGEVVERFFGTLKMLIFNAFPNTIVPFVKVDCDNPTYTWQLYLLGIVMLILIFYGAWKLGSQRWFAIGYIVATLGVISIFSTPSGNRYITSLLPFLTAFLLIGLWSLLTSLIQLKWKTLSFPAYILLLLLFLAKPGLEEEHEIAKQKYPVNYQQFFNIGKTLKKNTPEGTIVCSRKPQMLYLYSERQGVNYVFSTDAKELIADLVRKNVDLVVLDALGYSSTYRYLFPAVQQYPQLFPKVLVHYPDTHTYLVSFDRQRAKRELGLGE